MTTTAEPIRTRFRPRLAERPLRSKLGLLLISVSAASPARRAEQAIGAYRNQPGEFALASRHGHTVEETFMRGRGRS